MKGYFWLLGAIFSLLCTSCEDDVVKNKGSVVGYWSVKKAYRDKRETRLLADVYFQFSATGKMFTNLPNTAEDSTDYELKDAKIIQKTEVPITYAIQEMSDSVMILVLEMNNTPFEIHLNKTTPPPPVPADSLSQPTDSL
jgi:hypothetical protein